MPRAIFMLLAVLLTVSVAACGERQGSTAAAGTTTAPGPAGTAQADGDAAQPARTPVSDPAPPAPAAVLALEGEGLRIFDAQTGSARPIAFGTARAEVVNTLSSVLGAFPRAETENDCGGIALSWAGGPSIMLANERFVGWSVADDSILSTASGLKVGSSRGELDAAYKARVRPSSLGTEFSAGDLAGLLTSTRPDASVTHLWAGDNCLAR